MDESKKPGVSGLQKKNSYTGRQQKKQKWSVIAPDGSVVQSDLTYTEVLPLIKQLNAESR